MIPPRSYPMKKILRQLIGLVCVVMLIEAGVLTLSKPVFAPTAEVRILGATVTEQEELENLVSYELDPGPTANVQAASYLVKNLDTDQIITGKQFQNSLPVASLTKLMTIWTALQHVNPNDVVTVPSGDIVSVSPSLGLVPGDKVLVKDLVQACLVGSANDAADLLGEYVADKTNLPFNELMNQQVTELGMTSSRFSNAMGFDSVVNYSSAKDLALLVGELDKEGIFTTSGDATGYRFTSELGKEYYVQATNKLISKYPDLMAVKTGYTNLALGSMINILKSENDRWLIIVIGSPDRESDTLKLREQVLSR